MVGGTIARQEEKEYLSRLGNRGRGRNKKAKLEDRGSCSTLSLNLNSHPPSLLSSDPPWRWKGALPSETEFQ